jgi:RNA polymerase sigma-70 factor, ECF subfamily
VLSSDEKNIIDAIKQDDRTVFNTIFLKYHAVLCRISFRVVNDVDVAKDAVQEVFIKLWRNRKELTINSSLEAYLKRAVLNTSLNYIESRKKFISLSDVAAAPHYAAENTVEQQQSSDELSLHIDKAVNNLPIRTKAVFTLIRFEEMSYKEVANSLDISLKAVEKEMMKALKLLREELKDYLPLLILPLLSTF